MVFRELDKQVLVADSPMRPQDMADAAARGVTLAVNNRPDGEAFDQFDGATLEAAARAAGLDYLHIPIETEFQGEKVERLLDALNGAEGRALLFCKTGTRAAYLWALARAREGAVPEGLIRNATQAGYNIRPLLPWLKPREDGPAA
ncbi:MAG TPA: TIGR01244 family sulfur transferase [Allosphingosinicella sp.]|nr:TIGR01244 family sulfur transferase [Allosphingosinicella sp.]